MDKSPSPPKMDWAKSPTGINSEMTGSLTDHLQRLLAIKKAAPAGDGESPAVPQDDPNDGPNRIRKILAERDEMWREHERSQIAFMEREHERTLRGLHTEIERLQTRCADLIIQLAETLTMVETQSNLGNKNSEEAKLVSDLESQLKATREELAIMREIHQRKEEKLLLLEQRCQEQELRYKEESEQKNKQIQDISTDLSHKAALIAQLTTQLHQLRLREAVEKQRFEQRRQMAEQQAKRRQALAAAKAELSPHRRGRNGSPGRSQTLPGKVTVQVAAEPTSAPSHHQGPRRTNVRLVSATASASPSPSVSRTRSLALPSIMTTSTPAASASGNKVEESKKGTTNAKPIRSLSLAGKQQGQ